MFGCAHSIVSIVDACTFNHIVEKGEKKRRVITARAAMGRMLLTLLEDVKEQDKLQLFC